MHTPPQPCVYCGGKTDLTRDHIPPKSLFNKPRPPLITVRACRRCNSGFSRDDDYFWLTLASRAETGANREALQASRRAIENLARGEAGGFRKAFLASIQSVELRTPAGLYIGDALAYDVSFSRLNRVAARITKGLFAHVTGTPLPSNYSATARALEGFTHDARDDVQRFISFTAASPACSISNVFSFRFRVLEDDPDASVCIFDVYETTAFLGLTLRENDISWAEKV